MLVGAGAGAGAGLAGTGREATEFFSLVNLRCVSQNRGPLSMNWGSDRFMRSATNIRSTGFGFSSSAGSDTQRHTSVPGGPTMSCLTCAGVAVVTACGNEVNAKRHVLMP